MTGSVRFPDGDSAGGGSSGGAPSGTAGSERLDSSSQASIAKAIQDVTEKAQVLIREEIELAKAEMEGKIRSLVRGAAIGAAAGIFALAALLLIIHGLAWLAYDLLPIGDSSTFYVGFFFVAALFLILGALAGFLAAKAFKKGSPPTPQLAMNEAKLIQQTVQNPEGAGAGRAVQAPETAGVGRGGTA
jgi:hypothetical protein